MSNNMNKVNMSLDDIINNQRKNKRNLQIVKSNRNGNARQSGEGMRRGQRLRLGLRNRKQNESQSNLGNSRGRGNSRGFRRFNDFDNDKVGTSKHILSLT